MRSGNSKKVNHQTATGYEQKTSKHATMRQKRWVRQIFNEIIDQNEFTPEAWKKLKIKVLHKKGDVENVGNYRPTCSLPALYKMFSTILYRRLYSRLDQKQAEDQAGFRKLIPDNRPLCDVQND